MTLPIGAAAAPCLKAASSAGDRQTQGLGFAAMWKLIALGTCLMAGPALAKPPVWIVRDQDSEMVLFGAVHVLPPGLDWRPAALDKALVQADDLWFELPVGGATQAQVAALANAKGLLPHDQTLSGLLSPKGTANLAKVAKALGLAPAALDRLEPWFAEVVLAGAEFRTSGANAASGVEATVQALAPVGLRREAFETAGGQIALFDEAPLDAQIASLEEGLAEMTQNPGAYDRLLAAWMSGDTQALTRDALDPLKRAAPMLYDRLVSARNADWTQTLDGRLKGRGRTVVVVGVGHLLTADGVPARLRALGYSVEGP